MGRGERVQGMGENLLFLLRMSVGDEIGLGEALMGEIEVLIGENWELGVILGCWGVGS